ncbi:MAG: sulfatase-like hydrolase/transferase [Acidimicrobiia bacterium]
MRPNFLVIMTDQERYPPPYESEAVAAFRRTLAGHERLRDGGAHGAVELHRHYAASTACVPSRTSLFTGHYPSLHGAAQTDGLAKSAGDPRVSWLDPSTVPTMGDWFRAAGYRTEYRGKWHISHADLFATGTHESLRTVDRKGTVDAVAVDAYRRTSRLEPWGFAGWIGREPHGAYLGDTGLVRDPLFAQQADELFADLRDEERPWLSVISLVNPHDIAFSTLQDNFGFPVPDDAVPEVDAAPSQADALDDRPQVQQQFHDVWPQMLIPQPTDATYRRFYYWLHALADRAITTVLDALDAHGHGDDTIVVFTSDHGEMLGAHGGLQQKWYQAYDESIHVPFVVRGPGIAPAPAGVDIATSHVDVLPTLLGLAGIDETIAATVVGEDHVEVHPLVGRDLSALLRGETTVDAVDAPVYFMADDDISRGDRQRNLLTGEPYEAVAGPARVESVLARIASGPGGAPELWKLTRYFTELGEDGDWPEEWELHNLARDPEERTNLAAHPGSDPVPELHQMQAVLDLTRDRKRLTPRFTPRG